MLRGEQLVRSFLIRSCSLFLLSNHRERFAKLFISESDCIKLAEKRNPVYWTKVQYTRSPFFTRVE